MKRLTLAVLLFALALPYSASATSTSASQALATLAVKGRAPKTGYARELFGPAWKDIDRNGCDTRNDVLARDLTETRLSNGGCKVLSGKLNDPYSGKVINFIRGIATSSEVQIDHVVALSDAWQKGAFRWDTSKRERFANDPLELLAVSGPLNQQKSDSDAASWLPPNKKYRCLYVARQIAVKSRYGIWITRAEKEAMARVLMTCPNQKLPR